MALSTDHLRFAIERIGHDVDTLGDHLNMLDGKLGDGDLGVTIVNGFNNLKAVSDELPADFGMACLECAKAITKVSGSSFGTLMGISLMSAAKSAKGSEVLDWSRLPELMQAALDAMIARGGASLGDKTMLDALDAIIRATTEANDPGAMLTRAQTAVNETLDTFRDRECKIGRARIFGERTRGMDDPGMMAIKMMVDRLAA